jgi:hypothetical protein
VIKWFEETKGKDSFDYRFTGKDSRMFLHNFMLLIAVLEEGTAEHQHQLQRIHALAFIGLCLRDSVFLFSIIEITDEEVGKLKETCKMYFRANYLYYSVNPILSTLDMLFHLTLQI